jgi:hypothetical protein
MVDYYTYGLMIVLSIRWLLCFIIETLDLINEPLGFLW